MAARVYPEHFEGVTGIDRDDWLLSLDERAQLHRDCLVAMVRHLLAATLVGQPAPVVQALFARMKSPSPAT